MINMMTDEQRAHWVEDMDRFFGRTLTGDDYEIVTQNVQCPYCGHVGLEYEANRDVRWYRREDMGPRAIMEMKAYESPYDIVATQFGYLSARLWCLARCGWECLGDGKGMELAQ